MIFYTVTIESKFPCLHVDDTVLQEVYSLLQCYHQYIPHGREQHEEINATNTREEVRSHKATRHGELVTLVKRANRVFTAYIMLFISV